MIFLDAENLPSTFPATLSAKCLESKFPRTNVPCEWQFQVLPFRGFSYIFFLSFVVNLHVSGAPVTYWKDCYYSYQLYSDCSYLFVFFIYIFFRSEVTPKLYLYQHFNFQTYLFCFILLLIYTWVFHHGMCSICSLFLPFFYCIQLCLSSIFWYSTLSPLLSMFVAIPHCICVCVCIL